MKGAGSGETAMAMDGYGMPLRTYAEGNRGQQGLVERVQEDVERIQVKC